MKITRLSRKTPPMRIADMNHSDMASTSDGSMYSEQKSMFALVIYDQISTKLCHINPSEMMTLRLQILKFSLLTQRPPPPKMRSTARGGGVGCA